MKNIAPLFPRFILGFGFVYHGFPKLFLPGEREAFVGMLQTIGVPQPGLMAWAVGAVELVGGVALIAGAFVVIFGSLLTLNMLVAIFTVHLPQGFNFMHITGMTETGPTFGMPGYEVPLLYIAGLLVLVFGGAGALSVDRRRSRR
jgi:putative oxidoreductase